MVRKHPNLSAEELIDLSNDGVREQTYIALGLPTNNEEAKELTEYEFSELAIRIVKAATTKTLPSDAMAATAKALGILISVSARQGSSAEELVKFSQEALSRFADEALSSITAGRP